MENRVAGEAVSEAAGKWQNQGGDATGRQRDACLFLQSA